MSSVQYKETLGMVHGIVCVVSMLHMFEPTDVKLLKLFHVFASVSRETYIEKYSAPGCRNTAFLNMARKSCHLIIS
jgi:hypothetical protein